MHPKTPSRRQYLESRQLWDPEAATGEGSAYFVITFLGRKANNSEIRCFTFHISTKESNILVRLVHV